MRQGATAFCCWSGGKESALSFYQAQAKGINICSLLNMVSRDGRRSCSHGIDTGCLRLQAEAIGVPIIQARTSWSNYEDDFKKQVLELKDKGLQMGVFGDIDLQEHRDWIERVCGEVGINPVLPLWQQSREQLLAEFIQIGFKAIVIATQAKFLGKAWLGRRIDHDFIEDLKSRPELDLCGEQGEYHTFVFDGPIFTKPVDFRVSEKLLRDAHWFLELIPGIPE
ncbi:MAG: diphthine--ammonia ligase [Deltaproteobacteria bacterium]|nr:diphthine--ammonia ligase [Deltaproteobacteria bacterium]MBW1953154.1 diphthine--ammonia ligase [Deltaproteobacteria bacterium]MBW1986432.1 diphthine--ammonia ligase [Deltaproteobacteria bacterium]MBW2133826.1 diphthine--ammonia ligase [Deltaproteobacteria bacterium]